MPTGYTAPIQEGKITFNEYALSCARAFGACVMQRDDPHDEKPKEQVPSNYHLERLEEAKAQLAGLNAMTDEELMEAAKAETDAIIERNKQYADKSRLVESNYKAMLSEVDKWEPPTPEHKGLKEFMQSQITQSMDFDCSSYQEPVKHYLTAEEYKSAKLEKINWDIAYHTKQYNDEVTRTEKRNEWIRALYDSLNPAP